jgi:O-antigen ligase
VAALTLARPAPALARGLLLLAAAAGLGLAAVYSPKYALEGVVGLVYVLAAFRNLALGCALFGVLIFFGQIAQGSGAKAAGAVLVLAWVAHAARDRDMPFLLRAHPVVTGAAVGFVALGIVSMLWATSASAAVSQTFRESLGVVLVFVLYAAIDTPARLKLVLTGLLIGAFSSALVGIAQGVPTDTAGAGGGRLEGGVGDPNTFAAVLVPSLIVSAFWLVGARRALARAALAVAALVLVVAIVLTGSRGGLVALGVCFAAALVFAGPVRAKATMVMALAASVMVVYFVFFAPPAALQRITHFTSGGGSGRTDLWSVAGEMVKAHPVLGVGAGNFQVLEPQYAYSRLDLPRVDLIVDTPKIVHNTYLQVLTELGAVGFAVFGILVVGILRIAVDAVRRTSRAGPRDLEILSRGLLIGVLGYFAAIVFFTAFQEKTMWFVLGVVLSLSTLGRRTIER